MEWEQRNIITYNIIRVISDNLSLIIIKRRNFIILLLLLIERITLNELVLHIILYYCIFNIITSALFEMS